MAAGKPGTDKTGKSGAQGDGGSGDSNDKGTQPGFKELVDGISQIVKTVSDLSVNNQAAMRDMIAQNQKIHEHITAGSVTTKAAEVEPKIDAEALERMSRPELLIHIQKANEAGIEKIIKSVIEPRLTALQKGLVNVDVASMITAMSSDHKDFKDWLPEINALAEKVKGLDPEEMYTLVRAQDSKKATELDEKYKSSGDGKPGGDSNFGGLQPGSAPQRVENTNMSESDAASTAWNEVVGDLSAVDESKLLRNEELI